MRRIVIHKPGGYDRLAIETDNDPTPGHGEVLIDVEAIGVNFADCVTRMGLYASAKLFLGYPITPGFEVAGRVAATGEAVDDLSPGTSVLALTLFGGYATRVVVPRSQVARMPDDWSFTEAAGFPTAFLSAWFALFELAHPRPGARILVHSAAGGVGQALVQLGRLAGGEVTGVVGASHKVPAVDRLGATAIDKSESDLWATCERIAPDGFDVVLDANGAETLRHSYDHLAPGGKLVVYGFHSMLRKGHGKAPWPKLILDWARTPRFNPLELTGANKSVLGFNLSFLADRTSLLRQGLDTLLGWAAEGRIRPLPVSTYALDGVADAHRDLESGTTVGKLILRATDMAGL